MKILISNDDGIESPGIQALAKAVRGLGDVTVVAPERERSTSGHSLTLHKPLRLYPYAPNQYAVSGTPADCIYFGVREILKGNPDVILSGINTGANLGTDVHYSGTVAAAREGALLNIRSYAFSLVDMKHPGAEKGERLAMNFEYAAEVALKVLEATLKTPFPSHTLLNVNVPNIPREKVKGIRVARQGFRYYSNEVRKQQDPRGRDYYWIGGAYMGFEREALSDCMAVEEGFVSVAPLTIDCTHNNFYTTLKGSALDSLRV